MHDLEPFWLWRDYYTAETDKKSPFYKQEYSETYFSNVIYNYYIHPQWDDFDSNTLYLKILYADYDLGFCIIELIGEWNDCLYNDIKFLKRNIIEALLAENINKFILIGENVLNFHYSDDSYYQEWFEEAKNGWIVALGFRQHLIHEFKNAGIQHYIQFENEEYPINWRIMKPKELYVRIENDFFNQNLLLPI
ncbi:MAG: hypothetical protein PHI36_06725 [Bacteroidales bacterium]|nr:hypothetical protein [Bacteroidales bacterium]